MTALFSSPPDIPKPQAIPQPPKASDKDLEIAAQAEKLRRRRAGGRQSTILAGELGTYRPERAPGDQVMGNRTLLGGK